MPCCGWRPVSECTRLLLSRSVLFKHIPPAVPCAAPDDAKPSNRARTFLRSYGARPMKRPSRRGRQASSDIMSPVAGSRVPRRPFPLQFWGMVGLRSMEHACTVGARRAAPRDRSSPRQRNRLAQFRARRPVPRRAAAPTNHGRGASARHGHAAHVMSITVVCQRAFDNRHPLSVRDVDLYVSFGPLARTALPANRLHARGARRARARVFRPRAFHFHSIV